MSCVGKLAFQTLISHKPLLQRSKVLQMVGEFAFDYGLFAGHEDFRVLGDISVDVYVTYPHRSLEEFFGAFGFVQGLCEGQSVDSLGTIFMENPLVLRFCLWFLSSQDFDFLHRNKCYDKLTSYVAKRIDHLVFDPKETGSRYPAIEMLLTPEQYDQSSIKFFCDVLAKCKRMTSLLVTDLKAADNFLELMKRNFIDRIKTVVFSRNSVLIQHVKDNSPTLSINIDVDIGDDGIHKISPLLQKYNLAQRNNQIHLCVRTMECDITNLLPKYVKKLHIINDNHNLAFLAASGEFPTCPRLTSLTIVRYNIDDSVPSRLRRAIHEGKLPSLKRVELISFCERSSCLDWPDRVKVSTKRIYI